MTSALLEPRPGSQSAAPIQKDFLRQVKEGAFEDASAEDLLALAIEHFHPRLVLSCSFGAPEGLVLLDMMHRIDPTTRVFMIDTGRLPQATHDLVDRVRDRYGKTVEVMFPEPVAVQDMVRSHGQNLFYESVELRRRCCALRKVEPLGRYFAEAGVDAWVAGLRREQNSTRRDAPKVEVDALHGDRIKFNPLAAWSHDEVWRYVREHEVPTNRLHREGYPSVGCDPCSRAIQAGDDLRAGRWWWEDASTRECGLHVGEERDGSGI